MCSARCGSNGLSCIHTHTACPGWVRVIASNARVHIMPTLVSFQGLLLGLMAFLFAGNTVSKNQTGKRLCCCLISGVELAGT